MSKYKSPRLFVPSAEQFVRAQLKTVGLETETFGCISHRIQVRVSVCQNLSRRDERWIDEISLVQRLKQGYLE